MIIFKFLISTTTWRCRFERFANVCSSARKLFVMGEGEAHDLASAYTRRSARISTRRPRRATSSANSVNVLVSVKVLDLVWGLGPACSHLKYFDRI